MTTRNKAPLAILVTWIACLLGCAPAHASLIANGITYSLIELPTVSPEIDELTLDVSGINSSSDTEGGRKGIAAFAFTKPAGFLSVIARAGFSEKSGGLAASGCNGHGNFFCFQATSSPAGVLASNSSLAFSFSVSATGLADYAPDFKVYWVGQRRHYNLVSEPLALTAAAKNSSGSGTPGVPEPRGFFLLALALLTSGAFQLSRKTKKARLSAQS